MISKGEIARKLETGEPVEIDYAEEYERDLLEYCQETKRSKNRIEKHQRTLDYLYDLKSSGIKYVTQDKGHYRPYSA